MFKWPGTPSPEASAHELADFVELNAWRDGHASIVSLARDLGRIDDNDYFDGVSEAAYSEIQERSRACGNSSNYPFAMDDKGWTLRWCFDKSNPRHIVYLYLLLATRMNMKDNRVHARLNGTLLFERLCAEVAKAYLGMRAEGFVFSTVTRSFRTKVGELCRRIGEGGGVKVGIPRNTQDGGLDVVAWKPFADSRPGKIVMFGQCKTGTVYRDTESPLQPDAFCKIYMQESPTLLPIRTFFVAEALPRSGAQSHIGWSEISNLSGLLFDRCRLIDFCDRIAPRTLKDIVTWTGAAARSTFQLPGLAGNTRGKA